MPACQQKAVLMSETRFVMVYAYDIVADRDRDRIAGILEDVAVRVQRSLFEIRQTREEADRLIARLTPYLAPGDKLRVYALGATGLDHSRVVGGPPLPEPADYWLL